MLSCETLSCLALTNISHGGWARLWLIDLKRWHAINIWPNGGIPKGTKMVPLLFARLVNRLVNNWPNRIKYVDDTTIYEVIQWCSPSYLPCIANEISDFVSELRTRLNPTKCNERIVNFLQFQPSPVNGLQLMGSVIKRVSSYKILGVCVSQDLSWGTHIECVCYGELVHYSTSLISLLDWLASALASVKPAWLNFGQHRGPTYSYNNGSEKRRNWWAQFAISIANNNCNTKSHRVIKT